jgi:prepilin-type N-terminal cleavage/methylation domain-containing protein
MQLKDRGFTLVEVMVALALLTILMMSGGVFMMRATFTSSALNGRQSAVSVANQVLEGVRAVDPTFDNDPDKGGISPLVYGRARSSVVAQWTSAAALGVDVSQTYTGSGSTTYDEAAYDSGTHTLSFPLQQTIVSGNRSFVTSILVGPCTQDDAGGACTKGTTGVLMYRVVVLVQWQGGNDGCSSAGCSYSAATLVDPSRDPQFNSSRRPVANPDSASVTAGSSVDITVAFNDSGVFAIYGAVTVITAPANGTASVYSTNNVVKYTPKAGFTGTDTFTYTVVDTSNRASDPTVVTILVTPVGLPTTLPTILPTTLPTALPTLGLPTLGLP